MKNVFALMLAMFVGLGMVSCSSDDDNGSTPQFTMVGTWKVTGKFINDTPQDISNDCVYKGNVKFISGGTYVEDVWTEEENVACHLDETIGGNWTKSGNNYTVNITTQGATSILPNSFTAILENGVINKFEIKETSLGTTTRLVFSKQ